MIITAVTKILGGAGDIMDSALGATAALLFVTLIVCWIRSGRDKL